MKVLFVSPSADFAGAESALLELLRGLDLDRVDPLVLLPTNGSFQTRLEDLGVPTSFAAIEVWVNQASARAWERFGGLSERVAAMARRIEREACDLVVTNSAVALEGALAARLVGVPHVWRVHEMLARHRNFAGALPVGAHPALLDALSDRVAVVSRAVRDALTPGVHPRRIEILYNGLPPYDVAPPPREALLGIPASAPTVVFVGTLSEAKGVPLLAAVMERVLRGHPDARCVLVGRDFGGGKILRERARAAGIEDAFVFLGFRTDVMDVIASADALILPSEVDSLPCAVMEAMAVAVPPVATRSGGAEEMIVDGECGHLVDVGDVDAMARALGDLFDDDEHRAWLGRVAQARVRAVFSADAYVGAMQRLFDRAARDPHVAPPAAVERVVAAIEAASGERSSPAAVARLVDALEAITPPPPGRTLGSDRGAARLAG